MNHLTPSAKLQRELIDLAISFSHKLPVKNFDSLSPEDKARWGAYASVIAAEQRLESTGKRHSIPNKDTTGLRVGLLTPVLDFPGGTEEWLHCFVKYLTKLTCSGIAVFSAQSNRLEIAKFAAKIPVVVGAGSVKMLADHSDVLVMWGMDALPYWLPEPPCKTVLVIHGTADWSKWIADTTGPRVDAVVGVSEAACDLFPGMTAIINGVDIDRCTPKPREREYIRGQWGVKPAERVLGFLGRMVPEKDPCAIAYAVRSLPPGWKGLICGKPDSALLDECHRIAPDKIMVYPATDKVGQVLAGLDCFMSASEHEGFGLSLVEAWAAGVPTVTTDVGIVPEAQRKYGRLTHLVKYRSGGDVLAKAVLAAVKNKTVTEQAKKVARTHYSADRMVAQWEDFLLKLVAGTIQYPPQQGSVHAYPQPSPTYRFLPRTY